MSLADITIGVVRMALTMLVYGLPKVGKSTFGSHAPGVVALPFEEGTNELNLARFPIPTSYAAAMQRIEELRTEKHEYQSLMLDGLDGLEPLVWDETCRRHGSPEIDPSDKAAKFSFGRGYKAAVDSPDSPTREIAHALTRLRRERNMNIILIAHSTVKPFKNPDGEGYDRHALKIHELAAAFWKGWADAILFANYDTEVIKDGLRKRGQGGRTRRLYTERTAAFDAGNRWGLPPVLPFSWDAFYEAYQECFDAAPRLRAELEALIPKLARSEDGLKLGTWLKSRAAQDAGKLRAALNKAADLPLKEEANAVPAEQ